MGSSNKYCNNNHIKITWNIFLHYTISTLARLDVISSNSKDYNNSYILRKSIPIHPIWNNIETTSTTAKNSTIYNIIYKKQIIPYIQIKIIDNKEKNLFWIYLNDFIHYIDNEIVYNNIMEKYKKYLIKKKIKSINKDN